MNDAARDAFRVGIAPQFTTETIVALRDALANDDERLIQHTTTEPPPLLCVADWPIRCGCGVAFCCWVGEMLIKVAEVHESFGRVIVESDRLLGGVAKTSAFLHFWDDTPRDQMRAELLTEVELILSERRQVAA